MPPEAMAKYVQNNRLFCQTICPHYPAHPRFSGEPGVEHVLRVYISPVRLEGQGKVILEHCVQGRNPEIRNMKVYQTLEEAPGAVTFDPEVPTRVYEWLLADLSRQKGG